MITHHWSTPIFEQQTDIDCAALLREIGKNENWQIDWRENRLSDSLSALRTACEMAALNVLNAMGYDENLFPYDVWLNKENYGERHDFHHHFAASVATVFYITGSERSGDIVLLDPRGATADIQNTGCRCSLKIAPSPGKLIAFPGYLMHGTDTNLTDETRISVAGNWYRKDVFK